MLKKQLLYIVLLWSTFLFSNNGIRIQEIKFRTGTTKLTHHVIKQASDIYNNLHEKNFAKIKITGEDEENWSRYDIIQLAKKRSRSIRDFFIGIGCKSNNIKVDYNGVPKVILFKPKAQFSISGKIDLTSIEQQCFTVVGNQKKILKTKYGNVFVFEPNSFVDDLGIAIKSDISLCLWEFANKKDFIKGALSSGGKDEVLETASTFYIQSYSGDKELEIGDNKSFKVYIKRPEDGSNYKAYYGDVRNGNVEWKADSRSFAYTAMFDEGEIYKQNKKKFKLEKNPTKKPISKASETEEHLLLKCKKIGWVNCDRTLNIRNPCVLKLVVAEAIDEYNTRLVFKKRNVIVPGMANSNYTNQYQFNKVPVGESAYVVAYLKKGDGYLVAYSQVTLGYIKSIVLTPEYKTESEFNALLDSFLQ
jgi:hypothetical protein